MKKVKRFLSIALTCIVIVSGLIAATIYIQYQAAENEEYRLNHINALIAAEMGTISKPEEKPTDSKPNTGGSLDDIISGSIGESTVKTVFSNVQMITASTFKATLDGEEKTYRLIGVSNDGDKQAVKELLESLTKIVITHDSMVHKKGDTVELIYLWNQDDKNIENMINLQIVRQGLCQTTYLGTSYAEHPNIKYVTQFVQAAKDSKK